MEKKYKKTKTVLSLPLLLGVVVSIFVVGYIGYLQGLRAGYFKALQVKRTIETSTGGTIMKGCTKELKICPDGSSVGRSGPYCEFADCPNSAISKAPGTGNCMVGGCSGQLCGEESEISDMMTTCEYREEYACYKLSTCERQTDGKCGWSYNPEFNKCVFNAKANPAGPSRR